MNEPNPNDPEDAPNYSKTAKIVMVICAELGLLISLAPMGVFEVARLHLLGPLGFNVVIIFWLICIVAGFWLASAKDTVFSIGLLILIGLMLVNMAGCSMVLKGLSIDG
jgi:hypothetical protein